jgi:two-component system chemotaxis response regulator CheB
MSAAAGSRRRQKQAAAAAPLRILVVDDSALMRDAIAAILAQDAALQLAGTAKDGLEALAQAAQLQPDIILLDIEMPRMDGLAFLRAARLAVSAAVIVLSSVAQPGSPPWLQALALGASDILAKPSGVVSPDLAEKRSQALLAAIHACRRAEGAA